MATSRIDRSDDTAAVLKIIATVADTEDAVTKQWQGVVVSDGTSPAANKLAVSVGGAASVTVATSLPAGTAAIGKLAANSGVDIGDVDVTSVPAPLSTAGGGTEATALRVTLATDSTGLVSVDDNGGALTVDNAGTFAVQIASNSSVNVAQIAGTATVTGGTAGSQGVGGIQAHDAADANNNPIKVGLKAIAFGANPTAVAAADITNAYANRAGVQLVTGPHMNPFTEEFTQTDADGAQTNVALKTVSAGTKIAITQILVTMDEANTVGVAVRIGFATATLGAASTTPVAGILFGHSGMLPGQAIPRGDGMGIIGIGADDEDLRITTEDAVSGALKVTYSGFTIES